MTDTVRPTSQLDARHIGVLTEAKLIEWSISFEYDEAVEIAGLQRVQQAQVRDLEHQHDADTVEQYATHMRQGVTFPPLVLLRDDIILDGNTRVAAARQAGIKRLPAFKCNFPNPDLAVAFAGAMNQMGGRRLSPEEARHQAEVLMRYGHEDDSISRELGYGRTHVNNWRREREARQHAERTQVVDAFEKIAKPTARKLATIKQDGPFAAVTNFVADTKLPAKQVTELVKAVVDAPSEAAALNEVERIRGEVAVSGPPPHRVAVPPEVAVARRLLPQLVKLEGRALALVETDPERREAWVESWTVVRDLAAAVVTAHG